MPDRHVTKVNGGGSVRDCTKAGDHIMRDIIADWRRWTRAERIAGIAILSCAATAAALPYFIAV
jgi:hypothetical protein